MTDKLKALVEKLADKTLSFGCRIKCTNKKLRYEYNLYGEGIYIDKGLNSRFYFPYMATTVADSFACFEKKDWFEILGHPILIGDIIFKINQAQVIKLVQLWRPFGNKSLQELENDKNSEQLINFLTEILL